MHNFCIMGKEGNTTNPTKFLQIHFMKDKRSTKVVATLKKLFDLLFIDEQLILGYLDPRSLYEFPYRRSCQGLDPRDQNKVDGFEQRRKLSQPAEVIEREQQARAADVEHVQEPAQQESKHADGCGPVAPLDHFWVVSS